MHSAKGGAAEEHQPGGAPPSSADAATGGLAVSQLTVNPMPVKEVQTGKPFSGPQHMRVHSAQNFLLLASGSHGPVHSAVEQVCGAEIKPSDQRQLL